MCEPRTDKKTEWEAAVQTPLFPTSVHTPRGLQISAHVNHGGDKRDPTVWVSPPQKEGKGLERPGWHSCTWAEAKDHLRQVGLGNSVPGLFPSILLLGASFYPKASLPVYLLNWDRSEGQPINASTLRLPTTQCLEQTQPCLCLL